MWKFLLPFAAFVALVVLFAFGLSPNRDIHELPSPLIGKPVTTLLPQKRQFWVQQTSNSKAAISVSWARDLFVAMGDPLGDNAWSMRIQYKPLVRYIWLGAIVMALGGLIAATDRRYRSKVPVGAREVASPPNPRPEPGLS